MFFFFNVTICITFILCRRAHTLTVLFILTCALVYVTLLEETPQDTTYNTKRSVSAHRLQNQIVHFYQSSPSLIFIDPITLHTPRCLYCRCS